MSQLVIEIDSPEDEALLLKLLPKFNARLLGKKENILTPKRRLADVLDEIATFP